MKTERRHELQTNVLAVTLAHWIEAAKPYSKAGLALIIAAVVIVFATLYLSAQNKTHVAEGWQEYFDSTTSPSAAERLADISARYAGTSVAQWARLSLADMELNRGTSLVLNDKKEARDELRKATNDYQTLLAESRDPTILERATFGLARAHEAMGELDKARTEYLSIAKQWPDSVFAGTATARAEDLDRPATKEFYDWVAKYEPPRPLSGEPGLPGVRPEFLKDSLEEGVQSPGAGGQKPQSSIFPPVTITPLNKSGEASEEPDSEKPATAESEQPSEPKAEAPGEPAAEPPAEPSAEKPAQPPAESPEKPAPQDSEAPSPESK